jgi:hypothetical protein
VWLAQTAIPSIARYALVSASALEASARKLASSDGVISTARLSQEFARCELDQPSLARWLGKALAAPADDAARGLGASLAITIWNAFRLTAGDRLRRVSQEDCQSAELLLQTDEELRRDNAKVVLESDDIIAMHQPDIARFVRDRIEDTMTTLADQIDVDDIDAVYRMLLVEVLVLSYAVQPPEELAPFVGRQLS